MAGLPEEQKGNLYSDNQSVVAIVNKKSSKAPRVMDLVRHLVLTCMINNCLIKCVHIPGMMNSAVDSLSRQQMLRFLNLVPDAAPTPCIIPPYLMQL